MSDTILTPNQFTAAAEEFAKFHTGVDYLIMQVMASHRELDRKYRRALWFQHGCPLEGHCGDDGDMQCSGVRVDGTPRHRPLDFQRDPILFLEEELGKVKLCEAGVVITNLNDEPWRSVRTNGD